MEVVWLIIDPCVTHPMHECWQVGFEQCSTVAQHSLVTVTAGSLAQSSHLHHVVSRVRLES